MKSLIPILTCIAMFASVTAPAAENKRGQGASTSTYAASNCFLDVSVAIGALAVIGAVVGVVASSASQTQSFAH
jgi:hypothetical protein